MSWNIKEMIEPAKIILEKLAGFIPNLIGAILILFIGWVIAKIVEKIVIRALRLAQLDRAS